MNSRMDKYTREYAAGRLPNVLEHTHILHSIIEHERSIVLTLTADVDKPPLTTQD